MNTYRMLLCFFFTSCSLASPLKAQVFDDFQSGLDTQRWILDTSYWQCDSGSLQSHGPQSSACLTAATQRPCKPLSDSIVHRWTIWIKLDFKPSSSNYVRWYLKADQAQLDQAQQALFIQIGEVGSQNLIRLYVQEAHGTRLLASDTAIWKQSQLRLRLCLDKYHKGQWRLSYHEQGAEQMTLKQIWELGDSISFRADSLWPYAGVLCRYSTPSRHQAYHFDDIGLDSIPTIAPSDSLQAPRYRAPLANEILISEILYESNEGISEWIELYHSGSDTLEQSELLLGVFENSKQRYRYYPLPAALLFPGTYKIVARYDAMIPWGICVNDPDVVALNSWPTLSNDGGRIRLINRDSILIDEAIFSPQMHYPLLTQTKGVSLERVDFVRPGTEPSNWQSAAAPNFNSPGCPNTQYKAWHQANTAMILSPTVISPNNDGLDDILSIELHLDIGGFSCSIEIRDLDGRRVRQIIQQQWIGAQSRFIWDGLGRDRQRLPAGAYIVEIRLERADRRPVFMRRCVAVI